MWFGCWAHVTRMVREGDRASLPAQPMRWRRICRRRPGSALAVQGREAQEGFSEEEFPARPGGGHVPPINLTTLVYVPGRPEPTHGLGTTEWRAKWQAWRKRLRPGKRRPKRCLDQIAVAIKKMVARGKERGYSNT